MAKKYGEFESCDRERFFEIISSGYAAYIYCDNLFVGDELFKMQDEGKCYRTIAVDSAIHLPLFAFKKHLGFETIVNKNEVVLKKDGISQTIEINSQSKSDKCAKFKEGAIYLPAATVFTYFKIPFSIYDNDRFLVFGDQKIIDEMNSTPTIVFAGEMEIFGKYDTDKFTDSDFTIAKNKWREKLVGNKEINSSADEGVKAKIALIDDGAKKALECYNRSDDRKILFGTEIPTESSHLTAQYARVSRLAIAYATYGSIYYHNEEIRDIVLECVEWLYQNMYGEAEIAGTGWRDVHTFNWWDWHVGAADYLTDVMMVMEEFFTMEMKERYLRCHLFCCTFMRVGPDRSYASSRIKIYTKEALLLLNRKMLMDEYIDYDILLDIYYSGEGMHIDYVHWTHGMPYNLTYGVIDLERLLYTGSILAGTPLEFKNPKQYNLFDKLRYCYEPAIFNGMAFNMFRGRAISGSEYSSGAEIIAEIIPLIGMFGEEEDEYIANFIRRNTRDDEMVTRARKYCSLVDLAALQKILSENKEVADYKYAHAWFTGDRAAQQMGDYAFGLALASEREPNYESINGENKQGWYTGDGALYLYTDRDRHSFDGANFINCEGVAYKIPGTTVDMRERVKKSISRAWKMPRDFVGSMSLEQRYIVATMDYESYNFAGPHQGIPDTYHGGSLPFYDNDLIAKKSYFMLDKECVCLGAGINSTMNSSVITTLDHRRVLQDEKDTVSIDGKLLTGRAFYNKLSASYIHREGVAGFVVEPNADIVVERYRDESEKDRAFYRESPNVDYDFEHQDYIYFAIDHGKNPVNASYCYTILPMATIEETAEYSVKPEVSVIENTAHLQAISKDRLGITLAVFHNANSITVNGTTYTVDTPCLFALTEKDGGASIRISDPTQKRAKIELGIDKKITDYKASLGVKVEFDEKSTVVTINTDGSLAAPFDIDLVY